MREKITERLDKNHRVVASSVNGTNTGGENYLLCSCLSLLKSNAIRKTNTKKNWVFCLFYYYYLAAVVENAHYFSKMARMRIKRTTKRNSLAREWMHIYERGENPQRHFDIKDKAISGSAYAWILLLQLSRPVLCAHVWPDLSGMREKTTFLHIRLCNRMLTRWENFSWQKYANMKWKLNFAENFFLLVFNYFYEFTVKWN